MVAPGALVMLALALCGACASSPAIDDDGTHPEEFVARLRITGAVSCDIASWPDTHVQFGDVLNAGEEARVVPGWTCLNCDVGERWRCRDLPAGDTTWDVADRSSRVLPFGEGDMELGPRFDVPVRPTRDLEGINWYAFLSETQTFWCEGSSRPPDEITGRAYDCVSRLRVVERPEADLREIQQAQRAHPIGYPHILIERDGTVSTPLGGELRTGTDRTPQRRSTLIVWLLVGSGEGETSPPTAEQVRSLARVAGLVTSLFPNVAPAIRPPRRWGGARLGRPVASGLVVETLDDGHIPRTFDWWRLCDEARDLDVVLAGCAAAPRDGPVAISLRGEGRLRYGPWSVVPDPSLPWVEVPATIRVPPGWTCVDNGYQRHCGYFSDQGRHEWDVTFDTTASRLTANRALEEEGVSPYLAGFGTDCDLIEPPADLRVVEPWDVIFTTQHVDGFRAHWCDAARAVPPEQHGARTDACLDTVVVALIPASNKKALERLLITNLVDEVPEILVSEDGSTISYPHHTVEGWVETQGAAAWRSIRIWLLVGDVDAPFRAPTPKQYEVLGSLFVTLNRLYRRVPAIVHPVPLDEMADTDEEIRPGLWVTSLPFVAPATFDWGRMCDAIRARGVTPEGCPAP